MQCLNLGEPCVLKIEIHNNCISPLGEVEKFPNYAYTLVGIFSLLIMCFFKDQQEFLVVHLCTFGHSAVKIFETVVCRYVHVTT